MYIIYIYINSHKIFVIQEKNKKYLTLTRVKGLKLYPLFSFKVPEQNSIL